MAAVPKTAEQQCLEGSTPSPSACQEGGRWGLGGPPRRPPPPRRSQSERPTHARGSANGRLPRFERGDEGSIPSPRIPRRPARIRQLAERLGLNPSACGFDSHSGHWRRLGRQLADHRDLESRMLWVQLPPEPLAELSSWSSLECSPPCQGGDRGFKSHRGR
jgi:hypothetical protein